MRNWRTVRQRTMLFALGFVVALLIEMIAEKTPSLWLLGFDSDPVITYQRWYRNHPERARDKTFWLGVPIEQCPLDLEVYQEILYQTKPDLLVETGTFKGGSAYFFASMFDLLRNGRVVTIDIVNLPGRPQHPRITYITGSSVSPETVEQVKASIRPGEKVMVLLDSAHQKTHVLKELEFFGPLVTKGNYMLIHDTDYNGHPVRPDFGPGPGEAVGEFLEHHPEFARDFSCETYGVTLLPGGYLKRL